MNFLKVMKKTCEEYSVAIRYENKFAGEVVFHEFDLKGNLVVGIRLLPEFHGKGIASETLKCAFDYAKTLGTKLIKMKCLKENHPSEKMIRRAGLTEVLRDEKYIYFHLKK